MQRMSLITVTVLSLLAAYAAPQVQAQSSDDHAIIGVWSLNLIASSFEPGPGPKALTRHFLMDDDGYMVSIRVTVTGAGNPTFALARTKLDGKDYPVWTNLSVYQFLSSEALPVNTAAMEAVNDRTMQLTQKNAEGEPGPRSPNVWEVSPDGNTLTVTTTGTTADGEDIHNVEIFDRVQN